MCASNVLSSMLEQVELLIPVVEENELLCVLVSLKRCHSQLSELNTSKKLDRESLKEAATEVRILMESCNNAESEVLKDKHNLEQVWIGLQLMSEKASST